MEWISIKERLPGDEELVLCFAKEVAPAQYFESGNRFSRYPNHTETDRVGAYYFINVTHWMPLPEPPTK
jgi:hypothetical protein